MPDPKQKQKDAFHYALELMECECKTVLYGMDNRDQLKDVWIACNFLKQWAQEAYLHWCEDD